MPFKDRLKEARLKAGISKDKLAIELGISVSAVGNYETGISFPKTAVLFKMFNVLEVSPNFLFQDYYKKSEDEINFDEIELIKQFRKLDEYGKEATRSIMEIENKRSARK